MLANFLSARATKFEIGNDSLEILGLNQSFNRRLTKASNTECM